jgi:hypothetical protein
MFTTGVPFSTMMPVEWKFFRRLYVDLRLQASASCRP